MITLRLKCHIKKWKDETHGLLFSDGRVVLHQFEDPSKLIKSLIDNSNPLLINFCQSQDWKSGK